MFMVRGFLKRSSLALSSQQQTILSAASVIGSIYLVSAFFGFVRNSMLSNYFGDSNELGIFFASDDIPSLIFTIIVSGSISSAFVPVFLKYYKKGQEEAWKIASEVMNTSLIGILIFILVMITFSDFFARNLIGHSAGMTDAEYRLLENLMTIMMLAQLGFLFSSYFTSILHSFKRFIIPALAPVFMNIGVIVFIYLFTDDLGIYAPAWGTVFGALIHLLIQLPFVREIGFKYKPYFSIKHEGVKEIYRLTWPRIFGQAGMRFLVPLNTNLALFISPASNVILTFADDIQNLPVRIFGVSIGQAALPIFVNSLKDDENADQSEFKILLLKTIRQVVYFVLPVSVLFFVLRVPLIRLAYGASKYSWEATVMTSYTLGFFSISLIFQSLSIVLTRGFYALKDTKTPLIWSIISVVVNAVCAIYFVRTLELGVWSLALAFSIGSMVNVIGLFFSLSKKLGGFDWNFLIGPINRMLLVSYCLAIALYVPMKALDKFIFDTTRTLNLILLTGTVSIFGFITFIILSRLFRIEELNIIKDVWLALLSKNIKNKKVVIEE